MSENHVDRVVLVAILAALGGFYWHFVSFSGDVRERLARVETHLTYLAETPGKSEEDL